MHHFERPILTYLVSKVFLFWPTFSFFVCFLLHWYEWLLATKWLSYRINRPLGHRTTGSLCHRVTMPLGHCATRSPWVTEPMGHWATSVPGCIVVWTVWWSWGYVSKINSRIGIKHSSENLRSYAPVLHSVETLGQPKVYMFSQIVRQVRRLDIFIFIFDFADFFLNQRKRSDQWTYEISENKEVNKE